MCVFIFSRIKKGEGQGKEGVTLKQSHVIKRLFFLSQTVFWEHGVLAGVNEHLKFLKKI